VGHDGADRAGEDRRRPGSRLRCIRDHSHRCDRLLRVPRTRGSGADVIDLIAAKAAARVAAFARRKTAHQAAGPGDSALLASVVAGRRGAPRPGYMAIRTEIDPGPVMAEAAAFGPVGLPVIQGPGLPLKFARWEPGMAMKPGPFGAMSPAADD